MVVLTLCFNGEWNPRNHGLRSPLLMCIIAGALAVGETAEVSEKKNRMYAWPISDMLV